MKFSLYGSILAIITINTKLVIDGGSAPVILARDREEQSRMALFLGQTMNAVVHDLENGIFVLVRH